MGPADFRHAIDELRWSYEAQVRQDEALARSRSPRCLMYAVRLNCAGDKIVGRRPSYESVVEDAAFLQAESDVPTPIAAHLGIPLVVRKVKPALFWSDRHLEKRKINYYVGTLNPPQQANDIGSVIVARKDGIPLLPTHMLALSCYASDYLKDPRLHPNACVTASMLDMQRLSLLSADTFQDYYVDEWMTTHLCEKTAPSPFTITRGYAANIQDVNLKINGPEDKCPCCE
ncbi:hypothetical protein NX059_005572 [Plenodomus lindquistii]|nr:hypothetical protein NX059_005572 [Plenodomus lindquistii]